jgi:hypothetical protein
MKSDDSLESLNVLDARLELNKFGCSLTSHNESRNRKNIQVHAMETGKFDHRSQTMSNDVRIKHGLTSLDP